MNRRFLFAALVALAVPLAGFAQTSFSVDKIVRWEKAPGARQGIYEADGRFVPSVEAQLRTTADVETAKLGMKVYFFDPTRKMLATQARPDPAYLPGARRAAALPVADIFPKNKVHSVFFRVPEALRGGKWTALVVFGDAQSAAVKTLPAVDARGFDFAERALVYGGAPGAGGTGGTGGTVSGPATAAGPLVIEHVAKTKSVLQPQITMFFRMPPGVRDAKELRGLICVVAVGSSAEDVKRQLLALDADRDRADLGRLAASHKLGILTWGARTLWSRGVDYAELTPAERQAESREFSLVADGWAASVDEMSRKYGIPNRNILIVGDSQGAVWAQRLVSRKPERFLAASIRLCGTFDPPRPEAARVLWLLYDGELDGGYQNNLEYYDAARALGYPILIKTEPGIRHSCTPLTAKLQTAFLKWVLESTPAERAVSFRNPPSWGDVLSQRVVAAAEAGEIDPANRVALPTEEISKAWVWKY